MAKTAAEYQREYRQRNWYRQWPHLHPACREVEAELDDTEWQSRCQTVKVYGQYPAPERAMRIPLSDAERQRNYRQRNKFKVAASKVERLNTEQFQEDSYGKASS